MKTANVIGSLLVIFATGFIQAKDKPSVKDKEEAKQLALQAFKSPTTPFEAKLILTEWRNGESRADEVHLYFSPPNSYRVEFLAFDGSVKKVVLMNEKDMAMGMTLLGEKDSVSSPVPNLINQQKTEDLLKANYSFELKGSETFIGRPVWVLHIVPNVEGKPLHELRIDKQTLVVLEQRRYVMGDKMGSLTRFSTFEPKSVSAELFADAELLKEKRDVVAPPTEMPKPPESFKQLPDGFSLTSYRTFEIEGTKANHFAYTDGVLPLSIFETSVPVKFPKKTSASQKLTVVNPGSGLSSAEQVVYGKRGKHFLTIIGEASPSLLQNIANHLN